jgi:hypothetical protein
LLGLNKSWTCNEIPIYVSDLCAPQPPAGALHFSSLFQNHAVSSGLVNCSSEFRPTLRTPCPEPVLGFPECSKFRGEEYCKTGLQCLGHIIASEIPVLERSIAACHAF